MSLARYLSKLGALLNSDGKVPSGALASGAARANFGAGAVLQVVNGALTTEASTSSSTFSDTGVTATITPTSASSKILVLVSLTGLYKTTSNTYGYFRLLRGATNIADMERVVGYNASTSPIAVGSVGLNYLDSPSTTTATTYKVQFASRNNNAAIYIGTSDNFVTSVSTITLVEIAA